MLCTISPSRRQLSPGIESDGLVAACGERLQKLDERVLALRPDGVVDVGRIQRRVRTDGREGAAPDDRYRGQFLADGLRHGDCREQLRAAHDGDTHRGDGPVIDGAHGGRDEVAIDVAIDDRRWVLALERRGQAQNRERKARVACASDGRVDEQNTLPHAVMPISSLDGTSLNIVSLSLTNWRSASTEISKPCPRNSLRKMPPIAEGRQQHERGAARLQVRAETGGESLRDVVRSPCAVAVVPRRCPAETAD